MVSRILFAMFLFFSTLGCESETKLNEDYFAVGCFSWRYKLEVLNNSHLDFYKPSVFIMYYHDSIFEIRIDQHSGYSYFSGISDKNKFEKQKTAKTKRNIVISEKTKFETKSSHIWGCLPPMYFIEKKGMKTTFGMSNYRSHEMLTESMQNRKRIEKNQMPEKILSTFYELCFRKNDFEFSDKNPFRPMIISEIDASVLLQK